MNYDSCISISQILTHGPQFHLIHQHAYPFWWNSTRIYANQGDWINFLPESEFYEPPRGRLCDNRDDFATNSSSNRVSTAIQVKLSQLELILRRISNFEEDLDDFVRKAWKLGSRVGENERIQMNFGLYSLVKKAVEERLVPVPPGLHRSDRRCGSAWPKPLGFLIIRRKNSILVSNGKLVGFWA